MARCFCALRFTLADDKTRNLVARRLPITAATNDRLLRNSLKETLVTVVVVVVVSQLLPGFSQSETRS